MFSLFESHLHMQMTLSSIEFRIMSYLIGAESSPVTGIGRGHDLLYIEQHLHPQSIKAVSAK